MLQIPHHRHSFSCFFLGSSRFHAHVLCMWLTVGCYLVGTIVYLLQALSCRAGFSALLTPLPEMFYGYFPAAAATEALGYVSRAYQTFFKAPHHLPLRTLL